MPESIVTQDRMERAHAALSDVRSCSSPTGATVCSGTIAEITGITQKCTRHINPANRTGQHRTGNITILSRWNRRPSSTGLYDSTPSYSLESSYRRDRISDV
ncbi:MAG: hypothetical protein AB2598_15055 [Candidatus Thiodiazotropha sp.]